MTLYDLCLLPAQFRYVIINIQNCAGAQNQSYVMTDGQSASLSWCQAPSVAQDQIFVSVRQLLVCWCGTPSLTSGQVSFMIAAGPCQCSHFGSKSHGIHDLIIPSQIPDPHLEGQVSVFIPPRNRVAQLHSQAQGSLSIASYGQHGYSRGIQTQLHAGDSCRPLPAQWFLVPSTTGHMTIFYCQSQSYFMTGSLLPISLPWHQAPWDMTNGYFFDTEPLWSWSLCNILSNEKIGLSLMNRLGLCQVCILHI
jgi:hypothetical protein